MKKKIVLLIALTGFLLATPALFVRATRGFRIGKMAFDLYFNPAWETAPPTAHQLELARQITGAPLRYLSHGAQSFVFASEDGKYIVKLFRYDQRVHPWREYLRDKVLKKRKRLRHDEKIHRLFCACKIAYEQASDLTGLVYVHLNQTEGLLPEATLKDYLGRTFHLDLNRYRFVIQHRARPIREVLKEAIAAGDQKRVEKLLGSFAHLLGERTRRMIANTDTKVASNFGYLDDQAIEWDFGNYVQTPIDRAEEIEKFVPQIRRFLTRTAPEFLPIFNEQVEQEIR